MNATLQMAVRANTNFQACNETFTTLKHFCSRGNINLISIEFTLQGHYCLFSATCCFIVCPQGSFQYSFSFQYMGVIFC